MCTKPFSWTKNKGKLCLVAKSSGPLLAGLPLKKEAKCKTFLVKMSFICMIIKKIFFTILYLASF